MACMKEFTIQLQCCLCIFQSDIVRFYRYIWPHFYHKTAMSKPYHKAWTKAMELSRLLVNRHVFIDCSPTGILWIIHPGDEPLTYFIIDMLGQQWCKLRAMSSHQSAMDSLMSICPYLVADLANNNKRAVEWYFEVKKTNLESFFKDKNIWNLVNVRQTICEVADKLIDRSYSLSKSL